LLVALEVPRIPRMFVRALKISHEDLTQVRPVADLICRKMLEPGLHRVREVEGEVTDDKIIPLRHTGLAGEAVVVEPKARIRLLGVFGDVVGRTVPLRYVRTADVDAENPGARGLWAHIAVLVAVVATASAWPVCMVDRGSAIFAPVLLAPTGV
jgi:hypothetical protein